MAFRHIPIPSSEGAPPRRADQPQRKVVVALAAAALMLVAGVSISGLPRNAKQLKRDAEAAQQEIDFKKVKMASNEELREAYDYCAASTMYSKTTLKAVHDAPVAALLEYDDLQGERKFEASDVIKIGRFFYAICDSSWAILRVHDTLPSRSELNGHIGSPQKGYAEGESGFEGIFFDKTEEKLYLVREAVDISGDVVDDDYPDGRRLGLPAATDDPAYHAIVMQVSLPDPDAPGADYAVDDVCPSEYLFDGDSKGFEGATSLRGADGELYVLGLCEGNRCKCGSAGQEVGHGKVVVMKREASGGPTGGCYWKTVKVLDLPIPNFVDYSALAVHQATQSVAITSQENSQLWVGHLETGADGVFDPELAQFVEHDKSKTYDFPRNAVCGVQYCNVEGIHWVEGGGEGTPQVLVGVSDKMKSRGKQAFSCLEKDQSFHLFAIP